MKKLAFLFISLALSASVLSQPKENEWFFKDEVKNLFSVKGQSIHPSAFFQKLSFYSGVEIRYEKSIHEGLDLNLESVTLEEVYRFIDSEFSTLKAYSKDANGKEFLVSLSILPKGQFQSSQLVLAYDPVSEAVDHKQKKTPESSHRVYVTRMEKLEVKVRRQLEKLASEKIENREKESERRKERESSLEREKLLLVEELRQLKNEDLAIYSRKLEILAWKYPDLERDVNGSNSLDSME